MIRSSLTQGVSLVLKTRGITPYSIVANFNGGNNGAKSPSHLTGQFFFDQPPQLDCTGATVVCGMPMCALAMGKESLKTRLRERRKRIGIAAINFEIYLSIVRSRVSPAFFSSSTRSHPVL